MSEPLHPVVAQAQSLLAEGRLSRREFLRTAALLGVSLGAAQVLAACGVPATEAPATGGETTAGAIKRGGVLRIAEPVQAIDHPARLSWTEGANQLRFTFEYLTTIGADNIVRPYLLESWSASDDLTVWTLNLRQDIVWTNGDQFVADHVIYNFNEWLNPDVGSSLLGLWEGFLTADGIEKVDDYTVRLNLAAPKLDVPENLFEYPALIMHPSFDGDVTSGRNPSTGPYTLAEFRVGERVRVDRRTDYWQLGADGQPLPYLDSIEWIDLGTDQTASIAALQSGDVHTLYNPTVDTFLALRGDDRFVTQPVTTSQVRVMRMRVDVDPFTDVRVRQALQKVQDRQKINDLAFFGQGALGHDVHVAPIHPEWSPMDVPAYDPDGAKQLLTDAGYPDGLDISVSVGTGWTDIVAWAEAMQQDAIPGGFNITLDTMPNDSYWGVWTETPLGVTPWGHRPLALMTLPLAYIADESGTPVPWNETRWVNPEFSALLKQAQGTLDLEARRALFADLQRIMQTEAPIVISYWMANWNITNTGFQNVEAHPANYELFFEVWYDPDQDPFA